MIDWKQDKYVIGLLGVLIALLSIIFVGETIGPTDPKQYVPRFRSALEASDEIQRKATEILDATAEQGLLSGKSPTGSAAAAIYAASLLCNEKKMQTEVADVAQVTAVTIRNHYQEQLKAFGVDEIQ